MTGFEMDRVLAERRHATRRLTRKYVVRDWTPVRQARPRYVPDTAPRRDRGELAQHLLFLVGLVGVPFVIAVLPR